MTDKVVTITPKSKVEGVDIFITIGKMTTIRMVVKCDGKWFAVNPSLLKDGSKEFSSKEAAILAASNLEI